MLVEEASYYASKRRSIVGICCTREVHSGTRRALDVAYTSQAQTSTDDGGRKDRATDAQARSRSRGMCHVTASWRRRHRSHRSLSPSSRLVLPPRPNAAWFRDISELILCTRPYSKFFSLHRRMGDECTRVSPAGIASSVSFKASSTPYHILTTIQL